MNLAYGKTTDLEHSFVIKAGFTPIPNSRDFDYSSRNQIETSKMPRQVLNWISREVCKDLFGTFKGYGHYLIGNSPLKVWSFEPKDREKSIASILYLPETSFSNDPERIKDALEWNLLINNLANYHYRELVRRFVI